jgi:hypothetical protein
MLAIDTSISRSKITNDLSVLAAFLISGLLSGLLFAGLTTRPNLQTFWFIKGDKFLIPRYVYWLAFTLILLAGFAAGYSVSCFRGWIENSIGTRGHLLAAGSIIALSAPLLRFITPAMNVRIGFTWDFIVAPIAFLVLVSFALCVLTCSLRLLPLAIVWNLIFAAGAFVFIYAVLHVINVGSRWYDYVQWPILESMLALSYGNWIIWRRRVDHSGAAQQRVGPERRQLTL